MESSNFDRFPEVRINGGKGWQGWDDVSAQLGVAIAGLEKAKKGRKVIALECYHGVSVKEIVDQLREGLADQVGKAPGFWGVHGVHFLDAADAMLDEKSVGEKVYPYVTDDPVFGYITPLSLVDFFDAGRVGELQTKVAGISEGIVLIYGVGASLIAPDADLLIYADMPRWEIQLRFRRNEVSNLGAGNATAPFSYQYKRAFFVDWRVCDRHKVMLMDKWDYVLDTTISGKPKMIQGQL